MNVCESPNSMPWIWYRIKKKNRVLEYGQGNILRVVTDLGKTSLFEYVLQRFLQGLQG